jgi:NAD(P)-dependent dehydrogenase (short-subunit alcohol dehydrogenase family)
MKDNYESEFSKKNIVITGASSGVGLYTAIYFLNQNANVILACQDTDSVKRICQKHNFVNAIILGVNLEKQSEVKTFINCVRGIFTKIDILINCAGIKLDSDILTTHAEDFVFTMNTNLRYVFILIKELKPDFVQGASIINMSCLYGSRPMCGFISYAMSKAGLETLTQYAAAEYAHLNIRINAISACPINTNSLRYIKVSEEEINLFNKKMEKNIPLGRIAEGEDIVKAIIFLASKRSKKITGQIIKVDGGRSLTSSGYVHYKGMLNMNSKLEPDGEILNKDNLYHILNSKKEIMDKPITDKNELKQFVENTIKKSNFSTRNLEAFYNVKNTYYRLDNNNNILSKKFLRLESKSKLLRLQSEKDNKFNIINDIKILNEESKNMNDYMNNIIDNENENENINNENENINNENDNVINENDIKNNEEVKDENKII